MRQASYQDLNRLCRGITTSFLHMETRDAYGTEVELPHLAKWHRGEPDDYAWFTWWLELLRSHRSAGRACRRVRVVSEPLSDYQRWVLSFTEKFVDAGEDIRYVNRARLTTTMLPGSGDYYVFDGELVLFLHYAGSGTNASYEIAEDRETVRACQQAFETVWALATPFRDYRPD